MQVTIMGRAEGPIVRRLSSPRFRKMSRWDSKSRKNRPSLKFPLRLQMMSMASPKERNRYRSFTAC